jgi:hypothetical protein
MYKTGKGYGLFGRTAVKAVGYARRPEYEPMDAWNKAAAEEIGNENTRDKICPRSAFLCLCEAGLVDGVSIRKAGERKQYARIAVDRLRSDPQLSGLSPNALWTRTIGEHRSHQSEMNVVLALWNQGFIKISV